MFNIFNIFKSENEYINELESELKAARAERDTLKKDYNKIHKIFLDTLLAYGEAKAKLNKFENGEEK